MPTCKYPRQSKTPTGLWRFHEEEEEKELFKYDATAISEGSDEEGEEDITRLYMQEWVVHDGFEPSHIVKRIKRPLQRGAT